MRGEMQWRSHGPRLHALPPAKSYSKLTVDHSQYRAFSIKREKVCVVCPYLLFVVMLLYIWKNIILCDDPWNILFITKYPQLVSDTGPGPGIDKVKPLILKVWLTRIRPTTPDAITGTDEMKRNELDGRGEMVECNFWQGKMGGTPRKPARLCFVHHETHMERPRWELGTPEVGGERLTACAVQSTFVYYQIKWFSLCIGTFYEIKGGNGWNVGNFGQKSLSFYWTNLIYTI